MGTTGNSERCSGKSVNILQTWWVINAAEREVRPVLQQHGPYWVKLRLRSTQMSHNWPDIEENCTLICSDAAEGYGKVLPNVNNIKDEIIENNSVIKCMLCLISQI